MIFLADKLNFLCNPLVWFINPGGNQAKAYLTENKMVILSQQGIIQLYQKTNVCLFYVWEPKHAKIF